MAYSVKADLITQVPESDLIALVDDENTKADLQDAIVTQFQVDTANTSGHFEDADSVAVTLGPGNTAERIVVGSLFQINSVWYTIESISGNGSGDNAVVFTTSTIATGTYSVQNLASQFTDARITATIANADSIIDGYVGEYYSVPLSPVPDIIKTFSVHIAVFLLLSRRNTTFKADDTDSRYVNYQNAIKYLQKLNENSLGISPVPTGLSKAQPEITNFDMYYEGNTQSNNYVNRTFSRGKMSGF